MRINPNTTTITSHFESLRLVAQERLTIALNTLRQIDWNPRQLSKHAFSAFNTNDYVRYPVLAVGCGVLLFTFYCITRKKPKPDSGSTQQEFRDRMRKKCGILLETPPTPKAPSAASPAPSPTVPRVTHAASPAQPPAIPPGTPIVSPAQPGAVPPAAASVTPPTSLPKDSDENSIPTVTRIGDLMKFFLEVGKDSSEPLENFDAQSTATAVIAPTPKPTVRKPTASPARMELLQKLSDDPNQIGASHEQMRELNITQNEIYQHRWKNWDIQEIMKRDGATFENIEPASLKPDFQRELLQKTAHMPAVELMLTCPNLFRKYIFTKDTQLNNQSPPFHQKFEREVKTYEQLTQLYRAFGSAFYNMGFVSEELIEAITIVYIFENVEKISTGITLETIDYLPNDVRRAHHNFLQAYNAKRSEQHLVNSSLDAKKRKGEITQPQIDDLLAEHAAQLRKHAEEFKAIMQPFAEKAQAVLKAKQAS